jgi:TonB family protein
VTADPAEAVASQTTLASTASEVARVDAIEAPTDEPAALETEPAHAEAARPTATVAETAKSESAPADLAEKIRLRIASSPEAEFARAETASVEAGAREPERARVTENPAVSPQQSTAHWMGLAAAAVVAVAAMGVPLGVWLGTRHQAQPEPRQAAAPGVPKAAVAAPSVPAASGPTKGREVLPPTPQVAVAQPKTAEPVVPSAKVGTRTAAKTARKFETTPRPIALQAVPLQVVHGLGAPAVVEPQPVAEPPRIAAPTPPAGRLFEPGDVDELPRVATRVEPQVPGDAVKRDVVVVRVLVSQTGHPFRVSLLRRSLGGRTVDDAVVAAVSQWTFSPGRKKGEAVSCWMNFGVPIGH